MVQKLSTFLSTSLVEAAIDSASVRTLIQSETIKLDSGTSGNYIRSMVTGDGLSVTSAAHSLDATITIDSSHVVHPTGTQTLKEKTINLANNTLVGTLAQFNAAVSGESLVGLAASQTLTNKTLTSPQINQPTIAGPASLTKISTFGLRDATTTDYDTRIVSNSASPALSAHRTLTLDVNNANRTISLTGDLTLAGDFITSGAHATTLTTTGTTALTLPTSGTVVSKDGSNNFSAGTITADINRSGSTSVVAGTYGSATAIPIVKVDANGFVDSVGTAAVSGVSGVTFDSSTGILTVATAITNFTDSINLSPFTTDTLTEGSTNLYATNARSRASISVTDAGGPGSLAYNNSTGVITYTGATGQQVMDVLKTVDSNGSGLNADTLDGQQGTHYRIDVYNAAGSLLN